MRNQSTNRRIHEAVYGPLPALCTGEVEWSEFGSTWHCRTCGERGSNHDEQPGVHEPRPPAYTRSMKLVVQAIQDAGAKFTLRSRPPSPLFEVSVERAGRARALVDGDYVKALALALESLLDP